MNSIAQQDRPTLVTGKHLDVVASTLDERRADEHCVERRVEPRHVEVGFEAVELASVSIPLDRHVDLIESDLIGAPIVHVGGAQDHPGARAEGR